MLSSQSVSQCLGRIYDCHGSCGRKEFAVLWGVSLVYSAFVVVPLVCFLYWLGHYGDNFDFADELVDAIFTPGNIALALVWFLYTAVGGVAVTVAEIFVSIRRLHDLNRSGWFVLLYLVPVVGLFLFVWLMFCPEITPRSPMNIEPRRFADARRQSNLTPFLNFRSALPENAPEKRTTKDF